MPPRFCPLLHAEGLLVLEVKGGASTSVAVPTQNFMGQVIGGGIAAIGGSKK